MDVNSNDEDFCAAWADGVGAKKGEKKVKVGGQILNGPYKKTGLMGQWISAQK